MFIYTFANFSDGSVTPIVPLNVNPEFSHVATFTSLETVAGKSPMDGKLIMELLNSEFDEKTKENLK